jgi:hypothetical protein
MITTVPNIGGLCGICMKIISLDRYNKHIAIRLAELRSMYEELGLEVIISEPLGGIYVPYYPREKNPFKWVVGRLLKKSLSILMRQLKIKSDFFSSELLIVGQRYKVVNNIG